MEKLCALLRLPLLLACAVFGCKAWAVEPQQVRFTSLDGTELIGWLYRPAGAALPRASVVALHGCGGLYATVGGRKGQINSRHQAMAELLVAQGYAVLMPDSLTPRGVEQICTQRLRERKIDQRERRRDALAALEWVAAQNWSRPGRIAVLGWSHGASAVLAATDAAQAEVAARELRFALGIAFYPGCSAALKSGYQPNTRLLLLVGEKDDWTPPAPCIALGKSVDAEVQVYPDSYHGFDDPLGTVRLRTDVPNGVYPGRGVHVGSNPQARALAYARVMELLAQAFP